jgi:uncharacterized protein
MARLRTERRGSSAGLPPPEPFEDVSALPPVRGVLHRGRPLSRDGLVLTHGAGSSAEAPLLVALAEAFAGRGLSVLRCDLPYRQARPTGPPRPGGSATDREGLRRAAAALGGLVAGRVSLGGQSYGGRQASLLAASEPSAARGLLLLAYPLNPPGGQAPPRSAHFSGIAAPTLFVHGSADPFGTPDEIRAAAAAISAPTAVLVVDGGGHDLLLGRRDPTARAELADRIVSAFLVLLGRRAS